MNESMSARAAKYQRQITDWPVNEAYVVDGVRFDGYRNGKLVYMPEALLEAKGPGYKTVVKEDDFVRWFLRVVVSVWEPDWAVLMSDEYREQYIWRDDEGLPVGKPKVGWMTYLRARRLHGLTAPPPCEQIDIPDRGVMFVVTRDHRFSVENPDDIARAQKLTEFLEACGALVTIPPTEPF